MTVAGTCKVNTPATVQACTDAGYELNDDGNECSDVDEAACSALSGYWAVTTCRLMQFHMAMSVPDANAACTGGKLQQTYMLEENCCGSQSSAETCGVLGAGTCGCERDPESLLCH